MNPFYIYKINEELRYSAQQVIENAEKIFLIDSNKKVNEEDIISINENCYDIINNDFYAMIIIDKNTKDIIVSYGIFSYCHSLYYYVSNNKVYINISLHDLLNEIKIKPTLDKYNVNKFVDNGFVRGSGTLIKEIKKVPSLKTVIFKNNTIESINSSYINKKGVQTYVHNLRLALPSKDTKILLPLSGGYDSTLLAYLIKDYKDKLAFTVGSKKYKSSSELTNANKTSSYLKIPQHEIFSSNEWIESLPKIVDVMEGEMFDIGVFLCYFLIDEIKKLDLNNCMFITGDGADQVLNKNFYTEDLDKLPKYNRHNDYFLNKYPKHFFYYLIVKKIEWLLRLNNIDYATPFISKEFCDFAKKTTFTETKEEYKKFVKAYVPNVISNSLLKRGGLVHERYFVSKEINNKFLEILDMPKYKELFVNDKTTDDLRQIIYKMYIVFFNYIFIENKSINMEFDKILNNV